MSAAVGVVDGEQRMRALERANEVRAARAALKRRIASGEASAAEAILAGSPEIAGMAVIELMMSQRSWGRTRCIGLLAAIPLSENKTIGSMTDRQQRLLVGMLQAETQPARCERSMRARAHKQPGLGQPALGSASWSP
jgi:hypothetical protein